ncbi:uncharacterized protein E0L32_001300 [Thyridium curvatum]|uniref:Protein YIP n=1 Tax=Thyridium curvatum TaxID=1093900 RepID=A0A507AQN8_9PEZI|nr:uncharacterized protein E0L32_001300 [Thyridium curvatum]TPX10103.1 hypothetical protein E0L32_001300 [Thyridium curvatum]
MAQYGAPPNQFGASAQNLQFYPSSYSPGVPGQPTSSQGGYGYGVPSGSMSSPGFGGAGPSGVSGRMGEQGGLRTGWLAAFSTEGYENEPPLLTELGFSFDLIKAKTLAVLNPFGRIDQHLMDDSDLGGPIVFIGLFGTFLLFSGKLHFGYIYGLALMGSIALHTILSLMTPDGPDAGASSHMSPGYSNTGYPGADDRAGHLSSTLTFSRSASILGYCLLPLVLTALVGVVMPLDGVIGYMLTSLAICWSTLSSSAMFCVIGRMKSARGLVAYPVALFYVGFGIMSIFSSRGSGTLSQAAGVA